MPPKRRRHSNLGRRTRNATKVANLRSNRTPQQREERNEIERIRILQSRRISRDNFMPTFKYSELPMAECGGNVQTNRAEDVDEGLVLEAAIDEQLYNIKEPSNIAEPHQIFIKEEFFDEQPYNVEEFNSTAEPHQIFIKEESIDEQLYNIEEPSNIAEPHQIFIKEEHEYAGTVDPNASDPLDITNLQVLIPARRPLKTYSNKPKQNDDGDRALLPKAGNRTAEVHKQPRSCDSNSVPQEDSNCDGCRVLAGVCHEGCQMSSNVRNYTTAACSSCSESFKSKHDLINCEDSVGNCDEQNTASAEAQKLLSSAAGQWFCHSCCKTFSSRNCFMAHMNENSEGSCLSPDISGGPVVNKFYNPLQTHCTVCGKNFKSARMLRCHMISHIAKRSFSCEICHRSFNRKYYLTRHMRLHTGERPYKCYDCHKSYICTNALINHKCMKQAKDLCSGNYTLFLFEEPKLPL